MGRYKVLEGHHVEGSGKNRKRYVKNEVVESEQDLVKLFPNKFEKLSDKEPFEVRTKRRQLEKEEAEGKVRAPDGTQPDEDPDKMHDHGPTVGVTNVKSKLGENVTSDFPKAVEGQVIVLKEGREFFVAEPEDPDTMITEGALKSKTAVEKFLSDYLKK